jgi:hypothetical protein
VTEQPDTHRCEVAGECGIDDRGGAQSMSNEEAKEVLRAEFRELRAKGYGDLVAELADRKVNSEVVGPSGAAYNLELQGFWDDDEHADLRVVASIDDGGLRAFLPFTDSFTIAPSGTITDHSPA